MKVVVDTSAADPSIRLAEESDFKAFCVELQGAGGMEALGRVLASASVGRLVGDHAFVELEALQRLGPDDTAWAEGLEQMAAYARSKGWVDAAGSAIRAHVEGA